jgi:hypothetical protein
MKSFNDFKVELTEEEKSDYSKFDVLVRAGLANKAQMQRIHRILDKMQDDRPNFNNADKQIIQNLFNKMVDLVSNNKQIFNQTRRAVREGVIDTSDYKVDAAGRKYKAHRTKVGDTAPQVGDDPDEFKNMKEEVVVLDEKTLANPPFVLILKRKAVRYYPEGIVNVLYYNEKLNRYFSVPYTDGTPMNNPIQSEGTEAAKTLETPGTNYTKKKLANGDDVDIKKTNDMATAIKESVDAIGQLQKIRDSGQHGTVNHKDKTASKVDVQTAHAILKVHNSLNDANKKKFADMTARSSHHLHKAAEFAWKHLK